jgi:UDP-3-O-[3-hydroxymyristoyl] N-acetylglucosamine deacetylase
VLPAPADSGFVFVRTDLPGAPEIPGQWRFVQEGRLATTLGRNGACVSTVEHLLSALYGLGVDNALIRLDREEVPVRDGSALPWCEAIEETGLVLQDRPRRWLGASEALRVQEGDRQMMWAPGEGLELRVRTEFPYVGPEEIEICLSPEAYREQLAWARTFAFEEQLNALREAGLAKGGSLDNALVFGPQGILNPGGLRGEREVVRHKLLDLVGDLALSGLRMQGRIEVDRPGHALTHRFLEALLGSNSAA